MPNVESGAPAHDRASVWPVPYAAQERMLLSQQSKYDRRSIPLLWYWRLLRDDLTGPGDGVGATAPDEDMRESPRVTQRFAAPIAVHLYVDDVAERKKAARMGRVDTVTLARIAISRSEARRVGQTLLTHDVQEGLRQDPERQDPIFIPRPGDILRFASKYYEVLQLEEDRLGPTSIVTVWRGTADLFSDDINAPLRNRLIQPETPEPVGASHPLWRG